MEEINLRISYKFPLSKLLHMAETINLKIDEEMCDIFDIAYSYDKKEEMLIIECCVQNEKDILKILKSYFCEEPLLKEVNSEKDFSYDFTFYDGESLLDCVSPCQLDLDGFEFYEE